MSVAIFNSLPFHYEVFGYIINFAKNNGFTIDIFTNFNNNLEWLDFYNTYFKNCRFISFTQFNPEGYKYIFVTTDDDRQFRNEWISDKVISINHTNEIRNKNIKKCINIAKLINSNLEYSFPCYPYVSISEKRQNKQVCIIGNGKYQYHVINKLICDEPITLNIMKRACEEVFDTTQLKPGFIVNVKLNLPAVELLEVLKNSSYILLNATYNQAHEECRTSSGSIGLAFTTLCKIIIPKQINKTMCLQNCILYDEHDISLNDSVDFHKINKSRDYFIKHFDTLVKGTN
jgi:hypothetical protein